MNFLDPPMFDILNFQTWKIKMSLYLKSLRINVYLTITTEWNFENGKYFEANAKAT